MYVIKRIVCEEYLNPSASSLKQWESDPEKAAQFASVCQAVTAVADGAARRGYGFGDITICKLVPKQRYDVEEVK